MWTGSQLLLWGGFESDFNVPTDTGAAYDLESNTWRPLTSTGSPAARTGGTAVWTGVAMLVWGGYDGPEYIGNGAFYVP